MGIRLDEQALLLTLEDALARARSDEELPPQWEARVERLGELGVKTYIAALGGALLAKATNPEVDSLTQDEGAGPRGYSLRKATEFLALHNEGRYHLGAQGRWPLNNRPFLGGPSRIDDFTKISSRARPAYKAFLDALRDLHGRDRSEAGAALSAFLRVRMLAQEEQRAAAREARQLSSDLGLDELVGVIDRFVHRDPENGKRAQALVAAVLDCAFDGVETQAVNSPTAADVRVVREGRLTLVVEVKQLPVGSEVPHKLAREAGELGADLALLVVLYEGHSPLDREQVQRDALRVDGTLLVVCESVLELVTSVAVWSVTPMPIFEANLPGGFAARLRQLEVGDDGLEEWRHQVEGRSPQLGL